MKSHFILLVSLLFLQDIRCVDNNLYNVLNQKLVPVYQNLKPHYKHPPIKSDEDDDVDILTESRLVLDGLNDLLSNVDEPTEVKKYAKKFINNLKNNNIDNNRVKQLGEKYVSIVDKTGIKLTEEEKSMIQTSFNLMGSIFTENESELASRRNGGANKPMTLNIYDKNQVSEVVNAIKDALATTNVHGQNVNQNVNLNINIITLLKLGEKLQKKNVI